MSHTPDSEPSLHTESTTSTVTLDQNRKSALRAFRKLGRRQRSELLLRARQGRAAADPEVMQVAVAWARAVLERPPRGWVLSAGLACGLLLVGEWKNDALAVCSSAFCGWMAWAGLGLPSIAEGVLQANEPPATVTTPPSRRPTARELRKAMWGHRYRMQSAGRLLLLGSGALTAMLYWPRGLPLLALAFALWFAHLATVLFDLTAGTPTPAIGPVSRRTRWSRNGTENVVSLLLVSIVTLAVVAILLGSAGLGVWIRG